MPSDPPSPAPHTDNFDSDEEMQYGWEDSIQHCTDHTLLDELADRLEQGGTIFAEEQGRELARLMSLHTRESFLKGFQS